MTLPQPPGSICILRLSALGDATHVTALVRRLHASWPQAQITWIIGRLEAKLVGDLPGVEFVVFDKSQGWGAVRQLRKQMSGRRFDTLLLCQLALRAGFLSTLIRAERRIGYDRPRSRELHGAFINERVPARAGQHVLDALMSFADPLGAAPCAPRWDIPVPDEALAFAEQHLPGSEPTLIVSPCSSHPRRNWRPERYAAVADHAAREHQMRVVLCGGRSALEAQMAQDIKNAMQETALDLTAKDTLKQFLALCQRASIVLTPDAGPMHLANAMGTPVLGLHAATDPKRSGPYSDLRWTVDRYPQAARMFFGREPQQLRWGTRIEPAGVMDLVETAAVIERLDAFCATQGLS